jgi:hypothetical protein
VVRRNRRRSRYKDIVITLLFWWSKSPNNLKYLPSSQVVNTSPVSSTKGRRGFLHGITPCQSVNFPLPFDSSCARSVLVRIRVWRDPYTSHCPFVKCRLTLLQTGTIDYLYRGVEKESDELIYTVIKEATLRLLLLRSLLQSLLWSACTSKYATILLMYPSNEEKLDKETEETQ